MHRIIKIAAFTGIAFFAARDCRERQCQHRLRRRGLRRQGRRPDRAPALQKPSTPSLTFTAQ